MDDRIKQLLLLGREHYTKREFDRAEALLRQVLEHDNHLADVHDMLGVIAHADGDFARAERHFERALEVNPAYTEAALNLTVTYNDRGKYEAARRIYASIGGQPRSRGEALDPFARGKLANMHADLAQAYGDVGMASEAVVELEKAVNLCPQFADLRTRLGTLLRQEGDLVSARWHFEAAVLARPTYVAARIQLGVTLRLLGEKSRAEEEWRRVLDLEPENPHAKMYLRILASGDSDSSDVGPGEPERSGDAD